MNDPLPFTDEIKYSNRIKDFSSVQKLRLFTFSIAYALALSSLPVMAFLDRENYLLYAVDSDIILQRYLAQGLVHTLANEPLWLLANIFLARYFEPTTIIQILIFVASLATAIAVYKFGPSNFFLHTLILFFPLILKNNIIHLRQGLGVAFFLWAWHTRNRFLKSVLYICACLIHSSFFFIVLILAIVSLSEHLRLRLAGRLFLSFSIYMGLIVSLQTVVSVLGSRQAGSLTFDEAPDAGLGFVFWALILVLFISGGWRFAEHNTFAILMIGFYVTTYFFFTTGARVLESAAVIVLMSGVRLPQTQRQVFIIATTAFSLVSYVLAADQPWLGWGVVH